MLQVVQTYREFRDFLAAKKRRREPLRLSGQGATAATYVPKEARGFENFRAALRGVGDWGRASEHVDALAHALQRRCGCALPLPRRVMQNSDRSLTLFWDGVTVRAFADVGITSLVGGTSGAPARGVTPALLDLLGFQAKLQSK